MTAGGAPSADPGDSSVRPTAVAPRAGAALCGTQIHEEPLEERLVFL